MDSKQLTDAVESLVDSTNVKAVLSALATVCEDKATHVADTWQDLRLAREWNRAAKCINDCANRVPNTPGIGYGR